MNSCVMCNKQTINSDKILIMKKYRWYLMMVMICKLVDTHILRIFSGIWYKIKQENIPRCWFKCASIKRILSGSELRIFNILVSSLIILGILIELIKWTMTEKPVKKTVYCSKQALCMLAIWVLCLLDCSYFTSTWHIIHTS